MATKTMSGDAAVGEDLQPLCEFMVEYALKLLAYGATTIRIEKNVERIAACYGVKADVTIMPLHVMMTLWDKEHAHSYTMSERINEAGVDFDKNTLLSKLSWEIHDTRISLGEAQRKFQAIVARKRLDSTVVLILTGLANASFCRIFGGDVVSMLIVFVATVNGFYLKNKLHGELHWDLRVVTVAAALVSTIIASSGYVFHLGATPDIALGTGVLFLVPGVPFLNSMSDLIQGHYVCGISRFIHASIITICLSAGLCLGYLIINIYVV